MESETALRHCSGMVFIHCQSELCEKHKNIKICALTKSQENYPTWVFQYLRKGICAMINLQSVCDNNTFLICSKYRVASIKSVTIVSQELAARLLLAQLTRKVLNALKLEIDQVLLWTDSLIVD
ncbi:hypothetical protein AVEN_176587-1 [Araneus ventricosus]|uniref:Uncharacterized protein n=1 Tax=Araneus ventricosus TaxID=182803 RepID=A0A4Y2URI3_ARAVE|nr:hypothetical protein AVEN_176587-1 [Araneus ventricosus]